MLGNSATKGFSKRRVNMAKKIMEDMEIKKLLNYMSSVTIKDCD